MTTVKRDEHGLYVRAGGHVFRPQRTAHSLTHPDSVGMGGPPYYKRHQTELREGDPVRARHVGGTSMGRLTLPITGHTELWSSHGGYFNDNGSGVKPSTDCWRPLP